LGSARVQLAVDAAVTLLDLEEARVTPWGTPWVGAEPVVKAGSAIETPTNDLDGMATSLRARLVVVNTALVVEEVLIDGEGAFHRAVVVELGLDARDGEGVNNGAGLALVLQPGLAGAGAALSAGARVTATGGVWPAGIGNDTIVGEVRPDVVEVTTIATVVVGIARDWVLRREDDVLTGNTESVRESLSGTESPAWTALLLVSDGVDALSGELGAITRVEVGREGTDWGGLVGTNVVLEVEVGANKVEELLSAHVAKGVGLGLVDFPRDGALKLGDELVSDGVLLGGGESGNGTGNDELEHNFINNYNSVSKLGI
jgi:hypothetical protein